MILLSSVQQINQQSASYYRFICSGIKKVLIWVNLKPSVIVSHLSYILMQITCHLLHAPTLPYISHFTCSIPLASAHCNHLLCAFMWLFWAVFCICDKSSPATLLTDGARPSIWCGTLYEACGACGTFTQGLRGKLGVLMDKSKIRIMQFEAPHFYQHIKAKNQCRYGHKVLQVLQRVPKNSSLLAK